MSLLLAEIGGRLAAGECLDDDQFEALASTGDLLTVGMLADEARRRRRGDRVTFVRVFESQVADAPPVSVPRGAGEVRLIGTPESLDAAVAATRATASAVAVPTTGFALHDLDRLCADAGIPLDRGLMRLREAGLAAIAEIPADLVDEPESVLEAAARAALPVGRVTIRRAEAAERLQLVRRIAAWRAASGTVRAFAPLPQTAGGAAPSTGYDDVRQVALARLVVDNIDSIQVDWTLHGPKLAQVTLTFGADDVDRVSPDDTAEHGRRRTAVEEIRRNIRAASLVPVERNGCFETVTR